MDPLVLITTLRAFAVHHTNIRYVDPREQAATLRADKVFFTTGLALANNAVGSPRYRAAHPLVGDPSETRPPTFEASIPIRHNILRSNLVGSLALFGCIKIPCIGTGFGALHRLLGNLHPISRARLRGSSRVRFRIAAKRGYRSADMAVSVPKLLTLPRIPS